MTAPLRVASYNVRKAVGGDYRRRPERILDVPAGIGPDIGARPASIGWHGNAILSGPSAAVTGTARIEIPALEPRGAVLAEFAVGGAPVRVVGMHLDLSGLMRRRQARTILEAIGGRARMPTLLMGDMNEWRAAAGCIADFAADHHLVSTGHSFPALGPLAALARIFLSDDLPAVDAGVHRSPPAVRAADHRIPVAVAVRVDAVAPGQRPQARLRAAACAAPPRRATPVSAGAGQRPQAPEPGNARKRDCAPPPVRRPCGGLRP